MCSCVTENLCQDQRQSCTNLVNTNMNYDKQFSLKINLCIVFNVHQKYCVVFLLWTMKTFLYLKEFPCFVCHLEQSFSVGQRNVNIHYHHFQPLCWLEPQGKRWINSYHNSPGSTLKIKFIIHLFIIIESGFVIKLFKRSLRVEYI